MQINIYKGSNQVAVSFGKDAKEVFREASQYVRRNGKGDTWIEYPRGRVSIGRGEYRAVLAVRVEGRR